MQIDQSDINVVKLPVSLVTGDHVIGILQEDWTFSVLTPEDIEGEIKCDVLIRAGTDVVFLAKLHKARNSTVIYTYLASNYHFTSFVPTRFLECP